jgi:hypothetical protein
VTETVFERLVVPVKLTVCVLPDTPPALSVIVRMPVRVPLAVGVKVTLMMQLPPTPTLEPQLLVWEKSPVTVMLETASATLPVLFRVTGWGTLEAPIAMPEKVRLLTESEALEPVPVKLTVCGLPLALSVMVSMPVRVPLAVGVKVTLMLQTPPAAKLVPQVLVWAKSPLTAMLVNARVAVPELVTVTDWAELDAPTPWLAKVRDVAESVTAGAVVLPPPPPLELLPQPTKTINPMMTATRRLKVAIEVFLWLIAPPPPLRCQEPDWARTHARGKIACAQNWKTQSRQPGS